MIEMGRKISNATLRLLAASVVASLALNLCPSTCVGLPPA
jgi:hypothetical protein